MKEEIPNLPMRERESPEHIFEAGRQLGLFQVEQSIKKLGLQSD